MFRFVVLLYFDLSLIVSSWSCTYIIVGLITSVCSLMLCLSLSVYQVRYWLSLYCLNLAQPAELSTSVTQSSCLIKQYAVGLNLT